MYFQNMVLTDGELKAFEESCEPVIKYNIKARSLATIYVEQCCIDKRIQTLLSKGGNSVVYRFNEYVIRNAHYFLGIKSTKDAGWNEYGATNPFVKNLFDIKFRPSKCSHEGVKEWSLLRKERKEILKQLNQVVAQELRLGDLEELVEE